MKTIQINKILNYINLPDVTVKSDTTGIEYIKKLPLEKYILAESEEEK